MKAEVPQLNIDFERVVVVNTEELPWLPMTGEGVTQRLLEKIGTDICRTTTIIRCLAGSPIPAHALDQGEEIIVLEGEYTDELGVYPAGSYIKNPTGTQHTSTTGSGCVLFVKQGHLQQEDTERVVVDVANSDWRQGLVLCPYLSSRVNIMRSFVGNPAQCSLLTGIGVVKKFMCSRVYLKMNLGVIQKEPGFATLILASMRPSAGKGAQYLSKWVICRRKKNSVLPASMIEVASSKDE